LAPTARARDRGMRGVLLAAALAVAVTAACLAVVLGVQRASAQPASAQQFSIMDLGTLGGYVSEADYINDRGQIVIRIISTASGVEEHVALWEKGETTDLGTLGGTSSYAGALNNRGQVAGHSTTAFSGQSHAVLWSK
jgi:uncharacterized membrane protein